MLRRQASGSTQVELVTEDRLASSQRLEPFADGGRTDAKRKEADIQPCSQCRREGQRWVGELTTALLLRDRGP